MKAFLFATILEFFLASVFASPFQSVSQYGSRIWQAENGLPQNNILAVGQTADDLLWIATPGGITRFDSAEFKTYEWPTILKSKEVRTVTTLLPGRNGALWIGSATNELLEYQGGSFHTYTLPANAGIISLFQQNDDSLWIGTTAGLMQMRNGTFSRVGFMTNAIFAMCGDTNHFWFGTEKGLKILEVTKGTSTAINNVPGPVRALCADQDGGLWIGTGDLLVSRKEKATASFGRNDGLSGNITALHCDSRGTLWIGTTRGLFRMDGLRIVAKLDESEKPFEAIRGDLGRSRGKYLGGNKRRAG